MQGLLSSGFLNLLYMHGLKGLGGRLSFVDMLLKSEDGGHADLPFVVSEKARALALQPLCTDTWMVLDGEVVPNATLFVEVHPSLVR
jgi:hypothetical protein